MYHITLQRVKEYKHVQKPPKNGRVYKEEGSTIGRMVVKWQGEDVFKCHTLENDGESTDTPNLDRRIVARTYKLYNTPSSVALPKEAKGIAISTYTDERPEHKGRRIHIHIGNYPQDTEGCILLGYRDNGDGTIGRSTDATRDFYDLVNRNGAEVFTLEIKEIAEQESKQDKDTKNDTKDT